MIFNSFQFLWLFPLIWLAYCAVNQLVINKVIGGGEGSLRCFY